MAVYAGVWCVCEWLAPGPGTLSCSTRNFSQFIWTARRFVNHICCTNSDSAWAHSRPSNTHISNKSTSLDDGFLVVFSSSFRQHGKIESCVFGQLKHKIRPGRQQSNCQRHHRSAQHHNSCSLLGTAYCRTTFCGCIYFANVFWNIHHISYEYEVKYISICVAQSGGLL